MPFPWLSRGLRRKDLKKFLEEEVFLPFPEGSEERALFYQSLTNKEDQQELDKALTDLNFNPDNLEQRYTKEDIASIYNQIIHNRKINF